MNIVQQVINPSFTCSEELLWRIYWIVLWVLFLLPKIEIIIHYKGRDFLGIITSMRLMLPVLVPVPAAVAVISGLYLGTLCL